MQLTTNPVAEHYTLLLTDLELDVVRAALKAAADDDHQQGVDYPARYGADKGEVTRLLSQIDLAMRGA